jgi:hypothetical protein
MNQGNPNSLVSRPGSRRGRWPIKPTGWPSSATALKLSPFTATLSGRGRRGTESQRTISPEVSPSSIRETTGARLAGILAHGRIPGSVRMKQVTPNLTDQRTRLQNKDPNQCVDNTTQTPSDARTGYCPILKGGSR